MEDRENINGIQIMTTNIDSRDQFVITALLFDGTIWQKVDKSDWKCINNPKAYDELKDRAEVFKQAQCNILISAVSSFPGNEQLIKDLREKGLPKSIIVDNSMSEELRMNLSHFASVYRSAMFDKPTMIFSWFEFYEFDKSKEGINILSK